MAETALLLHDKLESIVIAVKRDADELLSVSGSSTLVPETALPALIDTSLCPEGLVHTLGTAVDQTQSSIVLINNNGGEQTIGTVRLPDTREDGGDGKLSGLVLLCRQASGWQDGDGVSLGGDLDELFEIGPRNGLDEEGGDFLVSGLLQKLCSLGGSLIEAGKQKAVLGGGGKQSSAASSDNGGNAGAICGEVGQLLGLDKHLAGAGVQKSDDIIDRLEGCYIEVGLEFDIVTLEESQDFLKGLGLDLEEDAAKTRDFLPAEALLDVIQSGRNTDTDEEGEGKCCLHGVFLCLISRFWYGAAPQFVDMSGEV